ncbi:MAG TPA: FUSC family protein [Terracidiphilus sp.]|jgi:hypothetical protein
MPAASANQNAAKPQPHFLADLYSFQWSAFNFRLPVVSAAAVAVCLFVGILVGHPGGGLIAGGGAFTIGFGANQRIADSRLIPMIVAVFGCSTATLAGTVAGHRDYWLIIAASGSALIYGVLTTRNAGLAWVGQQASVALLIASAFPTGTKAALVRAGLIAAGGTVQLIFTSAGLRLIPNLPKDLLSIAISVVNTVQEQDQEQLLERIRELRQSLHPVTARDAFAYTVRLVLTVAIATEIYRRIGIQSGYWIPMTALLVQRPAFSETVTRALARILGTLAGAWLGSLLIAYLTPSPMVLAIMATVFALFAFATNSVNYGLFAACLTGYIVFLLSLNQIPGPVIAHRRAWCTALGGCIAVLIHLDALLRVRFSRTHRG